MKKRLIGLARMGVVALGWVSACSSQVDGGDSESHFLGMCSGSCGGGLECVCGVCTRPCVDDASCKPLSVDATCLDSISCGNASGRICGKKCTLASECPGNFTCRSGACVPTENIRDGGSLGTGGDSSVEAGPPGVGGRFPRDAGTGASGGRGYVDVVDGSDPALSFPTPRYLDWHGEPIPGRVAGDDCCFPGAISWHEEGGNDERLSLFACDFVQLGKASMPGQCLNGLGCSGNGVSPKDIDLVLNQTDVRAAFTNAPSVFGLTTGIVTVITIDGNEVRIGAPCAGAAGCIEVPVDLQALATTIKQVALQNIGSAGGIDGRECGPSLACYPAIDPGPCTGSLPRFGYDVMTGSCKQFSYGGCSGNANNFRSKEACEQACNMDPCHAAHPIDADAGNCIHAGPYCVTEPDAACACACVTTGWLVTSYSCSITDNQAICIH
jgi:hypothetical protein